MLTLFDQTLEKRNRFFPKTIKLFFLRILILGPPGALRHSARNIMYPRSNWTRSSGKLNHTNISPARLPRWQKVSGLRAQSNDALR